MIWKITTTILTAGLAVCLALLAIDSKTIKNLETDNAQLVNRFDSYERTISSFENGIEGLIGEDDRLRAVAGIDPVDKDLRRVGAGGFYHSESPGFFSLDTYSADRAVKLDGMLERVDFAISLQEKSFEELSCVLEERKKEIDSHPSFRPAEGGWISGKYGYRTDPFTQKRTFHRGIDISNSTGTPIMAAADGKVVFSGWSGRYGQVIKIDHGNGYKTLYAHNSKNVVKRDHIVNKGDIIASMGSSGRTTGPHIHFEIHKDGKTVNPISYFLPDSGVFN